MTDAKSRGPLRGLRVVEFASIGPGPHCAMLLADLGADVVRIDRAGGNGWPNPVVDRGRASLVTDIRTPEGREICLKACDLADVIIEGFRPGVMERLGLGPDELLPRNPRLVYGRMTGWGQDGPLAKTAGHDINYIALTGALASIGNPGERSVPPLNLVGDFGGGSMFLAFGIMTALWERERSGMGQVVDAAIIDGVSSMMTMFAGLIPSGRISVDRAINPLAGAAPYYRTYPCADGREISVGPIEPQFWAELMERTGLDGVSNPPTQKFTDWDRSVACLEQMFATKSLDEWMEVFGTSDSCVAPVLTLEEAASHPHLVERETYVEYDGQLQSAPAPRFSRTPGTIQAPRDGRAVIGDWHGCGALKT